MFNFDKEISQIKINLKVTVIILFYLLKQAHDNMIET